MVSPCQRSILSCSRCRKRKMKCDRQLPSCSQCVAAKVDCVGISATASTNVPRSIVQHLESEIARLETELLQDGKLEVVHASDILLQMPSSAGPGSEAGGVGSVSGAGSGDGSGNGPGVEARADAGHPPSGAAGAAPTPSATLPGHEDLRTSIMSSKSLQAMVSATLPAGSGATDLLSRVRMGITPSSARVAEKGSSRAATLVYPKTAAAVNTPGRGSGILLKASFLRIIPADIVQRLMRKYLNTVQPDNPFLVTATVMQQFRSVAEALGQQEAETDQPQPQSPTDRPVVASHDFLVVYLILAISVMLGSANDGHEERCMALSASLFEEGIQHLHNLPAFSSDIAWLQAILLVLLYATVFPRSANVWVLSGAAMRSCLELGLHREPPASMGLDAETLDLRRRIFWAAYCMDRSICSALQRPLSTPDAAISTRIPAAAQPDPFLGSIVYHKLLSEMLHVHFHHEPIPADTHSWDGWLASMEERLRSWSAFHSQAASRHQTIEYSMARGLMILHRPSPRVPLPSQHSLLVAFEASATAERLHHEHIRTGFFRRPWLSAHYTLEAATVVLFCLRHGHAAITERFTPAQIFDMTKLFTSNFLGIAARGWPEVRVYAGVYERLLGPLLERIFLQTSALSDRFGPAQDAELMRLLYPGPAHLENLRVGIRRQEEFSPFDFSLFMADDEVWRAGLGGGYGGQQWNLGLPAEMEFDLAG